MNVRLCVPAETLKCEDFSSIGRDVINSLKECGMSDKFSFSSTPALFFPYQTKFQAPVVVIINGKN